MNVSVAGESVALFGTACIPADADGLNLFWSDFPFLSEEYVAWVPPPKLRCPASVEKFFARARTYHSEPRVRPPELRFFRGYSDRGRNGF